MKIVCISDTHQKHRDLEVPDGDILVHAGDFCFAFQANGHQLVQQVVEFNDWLGTLPHKHKVVSAGNHDFPMLSGLGKQMLSNATYLEDEAVTIEGIQFYGAPWQPEFGGWAFNLKRGKQLADKWALIPDDTDVLLTHGPAFGVNDGMGIGCKDLRRRIDTVRPKLHVFGHSHTPGETVDRGTRFVNAAMVNSQYEIRRNLTIPVVALEI